MHPLRPSLRSSSINVRHCTWLGFFLPPAVRDSGRKTFLLHDCESRQNICQNKSFPFHREITTQCCAYLRRLVECVSIDSPVFRTLAEAERGGEGNGIPDIIRFCVEEHILCHKGAYMGKNGITRDRTGKLWYYRNSKR